MSESLGTAVLDLTTNDAGIRTGLAKAESSTRSSFGKILSTAARTAIGIGTYFAAVNIGKMFVAPIKMAGDFQQTLSVLKVVSHATGNEMSQMSALAIKLGADIRLPATTAQDAATAMLELAKGGLTARQSMQAVHATLLLSTAAQIDNATSAQMVVQALNAFQLPATQAKKVVDDFAGAANASTASMSDIAYGMQAAASGAHALRIPVGDATTALAEMSNAGLNGGVAGAALNVALVKLANPTKAAAAELKTLGVNAFDSQGKFIGMSQFAGQFHDALMKLTPQQRISAASIIAGTRGMKAMLDVFAPGAKVFDKLRVSVERAGQAQQLANAQTSGFNGALSALESSAQTLGLKLGIALLPKMSEFVRFLTRIANSPNLTVALTVVWKGVVSAAKDLEAAIQRQLFGSSSQVIMTGSLRIGQQKIVVDPGLVANIQTAVDGIIARTDWSALGARIADGIGKNTTALQNAMNTMMDAATAWVSANSSRIASIGLVIALTMISKMLDPSFWAAHWQLIGGIALSAASVMFPEGKLGEIGGKALGSLLKPLEKLGAKLVELGVEALLELAAKLESKFGELAGKIALWIGKALLDAAGGVAKAAAGLGEKLVAGIINKIANLGAIMRTVVLTAITTAIGDLVSWVVGEAGKLGSGIANGIKNMTLSKLSGFAGDMIGKLGAVIAQTVTWAEGVAADVGLAIMTGIGNGLDSAFGALKAKAEGYMHSLVSIMKAPLKILSPSKVMADEVGAPIIMGIVQGMEAMQPKLNASIAGIADKLKTATKAEIPGIVTAFKDWAANAKAAFDNGMSELTKKLDDQLKGAEAKIAAWKATLTPAEIQLNAQQAIEQTKQLTGAVNDAWNALRDLPMQQQKAMSDLIAAQQANMAALQATAQDAGDNLLLAKNTFSKGMAANAADPLAQQLVAAQDQFNFIKKQYDAGLATQQQFIDAQNALDDAHVAAAQDDNAQTLLDQYNAYEDALAQQATAGAAVTTQQAQDIADQAALTAQQQTDSAAAWQTYYDALQANGDAFLEDQATSSRNARDTEAKELNDALVARYNRIDDHLNNVRKNTDSHYSELERMATKTGKTITDNLAAAMEDAANPGQPLQQSLQKVAALIAKYLKTNSPSELGPLSTLDHWMDGFAKSYLKGLDKKMITDTVGNVISPSMMAGVTGAYASDKTVAAGMPTGAAGQTNNFNFTHLRADLNEREIGAVTSYAFKNMPT